MIRAIAAAACAACAGSPSPAVIDAWQSFAPDPFGGFSVRGRSAWALGHDPPAWLAQSFVLLSLARYDGQTLAGDVEMYAEPGLDPETCAVEVVWDVAGRHGARIEHPTSDDPPAGRTTHPRWHFSVRIDPAPAIAEARATVFCPIERPAVRSSPPWGVTISSIPMVAAGPNARGEICSHPRAAGERDVWDHLAARRSFELGFACGVLPALRGGALVDDCTGEVMLELAPLGLAVSAPAPGAPLDETLLRNYLGGHTECARLFVTNVAATQPALDAAFARLGAKLTAAISREGLSQPSR